MRKQKDASEKHEVLANGLGLTLTYWELWLWRKGLQRQQHSCLEKHPNRSQKKLRGYWCPASHSWLAFCNKQKRDPLEPTLNFRPQRGALCWALTGGGSLPSRKALMQKLEPQAHRERVDDTGRSRAHICGQGPQEALPPRQHTESMWFGANSFVLSFMRCSKNTGENQAPSS